MKQIHDIQGPGRWLTVEAHPDDEAMHAGFLRGGYLLSATNGSETTIDRVGGGSFTRYGGRVNELREAAARFGTRSVVQLDLPDGQLEDNVVDLARYIQSIAQLVRVRGVVTVDRDGFDGHPDHIAVYAAARLAVVSTGLLHIARVSDPSLADMQMPVDEQYLLEALSAHQSQFDLATPDGRQYIEPYIGRPHQDGVLLEDYRLVA